MAEILIESSYRGMPVRLVVTEREVCYVIRDVCDILGYSNPNRALAQFCNNRPQYTRIKTGGGNQVVRLVNSGDLAALLRGSRHKEAALFEQWNLRELKPLVNHFNGLLALGCVFVPCPPLDLNAPDWKNKLLVRHGKI